MRVAVVVAGGILLALELSVRSNRPTDHHVAASQEAIRRIRSTGANVRTQAPLINHVNADPATWASMWRLQTRLGAIPYYMFVERDTGARRYFEVNQNLLDHDTFNAAFLAVFGLF